MKRYCILSTIFVLLSIFLFPASSHAMEIENDYDRIAEETSVNILRYSSSPTHLWTFVYHGQAPFAFMDIDTSNCRIGYLYIYNEDTEELYMLSNDVVQVHTETKDGVFYVDSQMQIVYIEYNDANCTYIGTAQGAVSSFDYFDGMLTYVEDTSRIVFLDISSGARNVVFTKEAIKSIYLFDHDKLIWRDVYGNPYYLNITSGENTALSNEHDVNRLIGPYVTPTTSNVSTCSTNTSSDLTINDISFPLQEYPASPLYFSGFPYPTADSYFTIRYGGHNECFGFAIYAHDKYMHLYSDAKLGDQTGVTSPEGWADGDFVQCAYLDPDKDDGSWTTDDKYQFNTRDRVYAFFKSLKPGAYVRYGKDIDNDSSPENGTHSLVVADIGEDGVWVYECNLDKNCGVYFTYYEYCYLAEGRYDYIHNFVNHTFAPGVYVDASYHTTSCSNCDGYLKQEHDGTAVNRVKSMTQHTRGFTCCSGGGADYNHTPAYSKTLTNASTHSVQFSCCVGTIAQAHTVPVTYTYLNTSTHRISATCCTGTLTQAHTQRTYEPYSTSQHVITIGCCNKTVYEGHSYNTNGKCFSCGYTKGSIAIQRVPISLETQECE